MTHSVTIIQIRAALRSHASLALLAAGVMFADPPAAVGQSNGAAVRDSVSHADTLPHSRQWIPITECGVSLRASYERIWNFGLLHSLGGRYAAGAVVTLTHDSGTTISLAPVGRVNLTRLVALDIAPGILVQGRRDRYSAEWPSPQIFIESVASGRAPGFALDASLSVRDWAVLFARASVFPYDQVMRSTYASRDSASSGQSHEPTTGHP